MPSKEEFLKTPLQSKKHWIPWIKNELEATGIVVYTPELPEPYRPNYDAWKACFEQFHVDEETTLVGHSCGGGFLVRWLSENKINVDKVALVAPWINQNDSRPTPEFFDFEIDPNLAKRTKGIKLFISLDDDPDEIDTAESLKASVPGLLVQEFTDRGHFTLGDMGTEKFLELKEFLLK